jgi:fluoride exporter
VTALLVAAGAAVGAPLRYLVDFWLRKHGWNEPWGTFAANLAASMLLGFVAGVSASGAVTALLGTGLCGALSTYSTFSYETMRLTEEGEPHRAIVNVLGSIVVCLAAGWAAFLLGRHV